MWLLLIIYYFFKFLWIFFQFKIPEGTLYLVRTKIKGHLSNHLIIETDYEFLGEKYAESVEIKNQNNLKYAFIYDKGK